MVQILYWRRRDGNRPHLAFCSHAILQEGVLVIPDATKDERFRGNPLVTGDMHIRFYAGAPLTTTDGLKVGTLCVIDQEPRDFTEADGEVLASLAALVIDEMVCVWRGCTPKRRTPIKASMSPI